jgi:hypothetical protein
MHPDHLGSSRLVTDLNKNVAQSLDFLPFGEILSTDSGISTHKFTGRVSGFVLANPAIKNERDCETSLDHTWGSGFVLANPEQKKFRQYSSQFGRWTSPDPAGLAAVAHLYDAVCPMGGGGVANDPFNGFNYLGNVSLVPEGVVHGNFVQDLQGTGEITFVVAGNGLDPDFVNLQVYALSLLPPLPTIPDLSRGGNSSGGGGSTLDDRANALANAINKTGVQSLGNPCTIATFYAPSAVLGTGAAAAMNAGEVAATTKGVAFTYWPQALNLAYNWLTRQGQVLGAPFARLILGIPKSYNKAKDAIQAGCNAMQ